MYTTKNSSQHWILTMKHWYNCVLWNGHRLLWTIAFHLMHSRSNIIHQIPFCFYVSSSHLLCVFALHITQCVVNNVPCLFFKHQNSKHIIRINGIWVAFSKIEFINMTLGACVLVCCYVCACVFVCWRQFVEFKRPYCCWFSNTFGVEMNNEVMILSHCISMVM